MSRIPIRRAALPVLLGAPLLVLGAMQGQAAARSLAAMPDSQAQQETLGATEHFRWSSPSGLLNRTRPLSNHVEGELREITAWLGLPDAPRGDLIWVATREDLQELLSFPAPEWFAAVTQPHRQRIIMVVEAASGQEQLFQTLRHELVHWAMQSVGERAWGALPAWFHEGVAQAWAADLNRPSIQVSLAWAAFHDELPWLGDYREGFGTKPYRAAMGYALAEAFVRRLIRVEGKEIIPELMARLRSGENLDQALLALTDLPLIDHEMELRAELGSWRALMAEIAPQSFLFLVLVLLVAAPLALYRRRRRHALAVARWEAEEQEALEAERQPRDDEDDQWLHLT